MSVRTVKVKLWGSTIGYLHQQENGLIGFQYGQQIGWINAAVVYNEKRYSFLEKIVHIGRIFFRGFYFLPVIFSAGAVLNLFLKAAAGNATETAVSSNLGFDMIDFNSVLSGLNLPKFFEDYLSSALSEIFMLVWQSGIQTILIIAGLQSIPELHYEVARVEGANPWETFWRVTFPQLIRTILLVLVFTIVELCSSSNNKIISTAYEQFNNIEYGLGCSMLWFYYIFVALFIVAVFIIYKRAFVRKWGDTA